jgi:hypothetical protein
MENDKNHPGMQTIEIFMDGRLEQAVSPASPTRRARTIFLRKARLSSGSHVLKIINEGEGRVALDAFNVLP